MNTQKTFNKLFARLQLQARLREIAEQYGESVMLEILSQAIDTEFRRLDKIDQKIT
jgi:hypothetical protein